MVALNELRAKITAVDEALLSLLAERRQLSAAIAQHKRAHRLPVRDVAREQALLSALCARGEAQGLDANYLHALYQLIIADSVALQTQQLTTTAPAALPTDEQ
ncbi:MAG: chorismate mutase [Aeromonas sp.]